MWHALGPNSVVKWGTETSGDSGTLEDRCTVNSPVECWKTKRGGQASLGYGSGVNCRVLAEMMNQRQCSAFLRLGLTVERVGVLLVNERVDDLFPGRVDIVALFRDNAILADKLLLQRDDFSLSLVLFRDDPDEGRALQRVGLYGAVSSESFLLIKQSGLQLCIQAWPKQPCSTW